MNTSMNMNMDHMHNSSTSGHMNHMTTTAGMNMGGGMGGGMGGHHNHGGGVGMDMNSTDRTCNGDMLMFFHKGNCEYILFEKLRTENASGLIGACFAIAALAIIYEGLKVLREYLLQQSMIKSSKYAMSNGNSSSTEVVINNKNVGIHMISCSHFIQTCLHMIQVFISYCLMLVFMTYNVWLCLAVVLGAGVGYFLFGWRKAIVVDINEHCH